jgi:hypothetical protein
MTNNTQNLAPPISFTSASCLTSHIDDPANYLIPNFVEAGVTTFIKVERDAEAGAYPTRIAHAISGGLRLPPYGAEKPHKTLLVYGSKAVRASALEATAMLTSGGSAEVNAIAQSNLQFYHPRASGCSALNLRAPETCEEFCERVIGHVDCVVFDDLDSSLAIPSTEKEPRPLGDFFLKLNRAKVAVVATGSAAVLNRIDSELTAVSRTSVSLHRDPTAPTEVGGGFIVKRRRTDIHDPVPRRFRYYYQIVKGQFSDDFSLDDPSKDSLKQLAILERQMQVARLLGQGMSQKDIADAMELTAATVCRDAEAIKSKNSSRIQTLEAASV